MGRIQVRSLRGPLYGLVLLAILPGISIVLGFGISERRSEAADASAAALGFARLAAHDQQQVLTSTHDLLTALVGQDQIASGDADICSRYLASLLPSFPYLANMGVATSDGNVFCSALPLTAAVNISDRRDFQGAMATGDFSVGEFQVARTSERASIHFGYPVRNEAGGLWGVAYAAVDLAWLGQLAEIAGLPPGTTVTVIDSQGTVLARFPDPEGWVGKEVPEAPLFQAVQAGQTEGTFEGIGLDGTRKLFGYTGLLSNHPGAVYVSVEIPAAVAYARVDQAIVRAGLALGSVLVLGLIATWAGSEYFILRRTRALEMVAGRLAAGELGARTGLQDTKDELGRVTSALDTLAEAYQRRLEERDHALAQLSVVVRALRTMSEGNAALIRAVSEEELLGTICQVIVKSGYRSAWVGFAEQDEKRSIRTAAYAGMLGEQFAGMELSWAEDVHGQNPVGEAIRSASRQIVQDLSASPFHPGWSETKLGRESTSAIVLPLKSAPGAAFAALIICSGDLGAFESEEEVKLLEEMAEDLAYGIGALRTRRAREAVELQLERQLERLQSLRAIDNAIVSSLDIKVTLAVLLDQVTGQLGVEAAQVLLLEPQSLQLEHVASRGFRTRAFEYTRLRFGQGQAGKAAASRQPVRVDDLRTFPGEFTRAPLFAEEGFVCYYAMPLVAKGEVNGVLEVFGRKPFTIDREWEEYLATLAGQAAVAVDSGRLFQGLQRSNTDLTMAYEATIEGWSRALDMRDKETEGHTQRVTEVTERLARAMGFDEQALVHIHRGSLLHDIGKMGVPDHILLKPGPLTDEEWVAMRRHPALAYELLSPIEYLARALDIPYCHHEKWDGTGYPRALAGEAIPLAARVFAIIDVWDALRSDRPYRPAWPEARVRDYIREQTGKHFDPHVTEAFLAMGV